MTTLADIETAADALPAGEKQELLLFLAARLRAKHMLPEPRKLTPDQTAAWIKEDEADMRRFREGK